MNIFACVKSVPDSDTIRFDSQTGNMQRTGCAAMLNPCDLVTLEVANRLAAQSNAQLKAVSMGPPSAETALRSALSMGAKEAHLLSSKHFSGADVLATAYTLSAFFKAQPDWKLILCGKHSSDGDTGQTGAMLAEMLGIPHAASVSEIISLKENQVRLCQKLDGQVFQLTMQLPCLLIISNDAMRPGVPTLAATLKARKLPIIFQDESTIPIDNSRCGIKGSATRVKKMFVADSSRQGKQVSLKTLDKFADLLWDKVGKNEQ